MIKWDQNAIAAAVHRRGTTLDQFALDHGLGASSCRSALRRPTPRGDRVIATFSRVPVLKLWPDWCDVGGNRLRAADKASRRRKPGAPTSAHPAQYRVAEVA